MGAEAGGQMNNKVINMVDYTDNCLTWGGKQVLQELLADIEAGEFSDKLIVIGIDKGKNEFSVQWCKAGLLNSEALAALEIVKADIISFLRGHDG
jgi:hypothetical protein